METLGSVVQSHVNLAEELAKGGVEFVMGAYVDILGRSKSKIVPISLLARVIAGSERYTPRGLGDLGVMTPDEEEVVAVPDPASLIRLPWDRRFVWLAADMSFGGKEPFALCTRTILKRQLKAAAEMGYTFQLGVEPEFYVFKPDAAAGTGELEPIARSEKIKPTPAYDVEAVLDSMPFLSDVVGAMNEVGYGLFSFDAEGGTGQYEFDFEHRDALTMCDRLVFFKLMVRQIAKQHGLAVTFMPKPYTGSWGSGAHFNMSLESIEGGINQFVNAGEKGGMGPWTDQAKCFAGGILKHARAIAAVTTPTVNSYKRLTERLSDGTVSWAPVWVTHGNNNRSCMLRFPANRPAIENRAVDISANFYLAAAFLLAAGLAGIRDGCYPGEAMETNAYLYAEDSSIPHLPRSLLEAIEAFEADPLTHEVFPKAFVRDYAAMKRKEWNSYHATVTEWEREHYLYDL